MAPERELDYAEYWRRALPWTRYFEEEVVEHRELWEGVYRRAQVPEWAVRRVADTGAQWKLLVLSEDWCGDASNTVPILARFAEQAEDVELRILKRDENPELMDRYLTNGSRSIPLAIVLDQEFRPVGRWGPRPAELQEYVLAEKRAERQAKAEIYEETRRWYARDRGVTTLEELLTAVEKAPLTGMEA
jgi:hypothetical protein